MKHFDLSAKATKLCSNIFTKIKQIDETYGVQQVIASLIEKIQTFDKKNQISQKSKILIATVDEKYGVSAYVEKCSWMEKVQIISQSINETMQSVGEIGQEIKTFEEQQKAKPKETETKEEVQKKMTEKEKGE